MTTTQQQADIAAHIEKLLFEHDTVIVPTFGGFTTSRVPASIDFVGGVTNPPSKSLAFNENLTVDDGILVHEVARTQNLDEHEARKLVLDFVEKTKAALNSRDIVTFEGVGRLYKNYAQKIQFLPDTTNFNVDSFGLPPLQFSPVARNSEEAIPTVAASSPAVANTKIAQSTTPPVTTPIAAPNLDPQPSAVVERTLQSENPMRSLTAFLVGLLLFSVAVGFYLYNRKKSAAATEQISSIGNSPAVLPTPGAIMDEAQKAAENQIAANKPTAPAADSDTDRDAPDEAAEVTSKKIEAAKRAAEERATANNKSENKAGKATGAKRCVLIVGTFKEKDNVNKLLAKLKAAGFDTYHRMQKGHQVGIEFHYESMEEIQQKMEALQKLTGEDHIWIKKR